MSPMFWLDIAALSVSLAVAASLALIVLGFEPRRALNRSFALFALLTATWAVFSLLLRLSLWLEKGNPLLLAELASLALSLMGIVLLMFAFRYVGYRSRWADLPVALGLVISFILAVPLFRHQLVFNPRLDANGSTTLDLSGWGLLAAAVPALYFVWSLVLFWQERRRTGELYLALSALILVIGFFIGGVLEIRFPVLSVTSTLGVTILGYGIVSRQLFNPVRESEERFRAIVDGLNDAIFIHDLNTGAVVDVNSKACEMYGYTREEVRQLSIQALSSGERPYTQQEATAWIQKAREGEPQIFEWRARDKKGRLFWVEANLRRATIGGQDRMLVAVRDITDRKQAEDVLRENEARYRALFEQSPISLWEEDFSEVKCYLDRLRSSGVSDLRAYFEEHPDAIAHCAGQVKILDVNQATLRLLKAQSKDRLHEGLGTVFTSESQDTFREELITLASGQMWFGAEAVHRTMTGDTLDTAVSLVVVPGHEDTWSRVFVSVIDITDRKRVEQERGQLLSTLEHRSTQLQTAAQVSKAASTMLNPQALMDQTVKLVRERFDLYYVGIFLVDEAAEQAVLRAGSGEAGRLMLEASHRLRIGGRSMIGWCIANARPRVAFDVGKDATHFDNPFLPETRSELALPLLSRGRCIGALSVQSVEEAAFPDGDISALQTMADQLAIAIDNARLYSQIQRHAAELESRVAERTAELAAVNSELEAFAYSVSHDLRAPLRSIDGFGQALLEDYADALDAVGQDYLRRVRAASQRMGQLIDDLLNLSRVTRGALHRQTVDLSELAREIAAELHETQPDRQVAFVIAQGVVANGDARLLRVVLENLLGNAWKFTAKHPRARIEFGCTQSDGEEVYFVRDDGAGFDMAYVDKLFGAFQRLHGVIEFEGAGVGLATVQRIIHRHGGRVWAEGAVEQGATFYFTLATKGDRAE